MFAFPSPLLIPFGISFTLFISAIYSPVVKGDHVHSQVSKEKVIWLVEDKVENKDLLSKNSAETSTASYIENVIIQQLSHYKIEIERVTAGRINRILSTKENVCVANRAKTAKRKEYSLFSDPQSFYLTHKLYRFNAKHPLPTQLLNEKGEIKRLNSVFSTLPTKTIGLAQDVSFGNFLDQQIQLVNPKNIYYRGGNQRVVALASMLFKARVDFLLALPVDVIPDETQKGLIEQYTIAGAPPYLIAHFNCSKSEFGQGVIKDIDAALAELYKTEDYYQAHKKWFSAKQLSNLHIFLAEKFSNKRYINTTKVK